VEGAIFRSCTMNEYGVAAIRVILPAFSYLSGWHVPSDKIISAGPIVSNTQVGMRIMKMKGNLKGAGSIRWPIHSGGIFRYLMTGFCGSMRSRGVMA
jgi:hypothetical protein